MRVLVFSIVTETETGTKGQVSKKKKQKFENLNIFWNPCFPMRETGTGI